MTMGRWRDPWPLAPQHRPTGWCILDGHGTEPWRMIELLPLRNAGLGMIMVCALHDGGAADGTLTSPTYNKPMCANPTCRMRAGHEGNHVPLAREMRR